MTRDGHIEKRSQWIRHAVIYKITNTLTRRSPKQIDTIHGFKYKPWNTQIQYKNTRVIVKTLTLTSDTYVLYWVVQKCLGDTQKTYTRYKHNTSKNPRCHRCEAPRSYGVTQGVTMPDVTAPNMSGNNWRVPVRVRRCSKNPGHNQNSSIPGFSYPNSFARPGN